ncbi:MAG: hypothetical protein R3Y63_02710 [Eubacteriales bacterium]
MSIEKNMKEFFMNFRLALVGVFCLFLTACSQEEDTHTTEVFPPSLSFAGETPPETEEDVIEKEEEKESEEEEEEGIRRQVVPEYATASSYFPSSPSEEYTADMSFDNTELTAWVENGDGFGAGEWLCHHFPWLEEVQELWIYNGHGEFRDKYAEISEISLSFSSGEEGIYSLQAGWNMIVLEEPVMTNQVKLTILNADASNGENSAIGEMKLFPSSEEGATAQLGKETVLKNMGALGDCSNITPEQALAFAVQLQQVMDWAETTSAERGQLGEEYSFYTGDALLFAGGDGVPVLYYDYDFPVVDSLFVTETDVVVWDGQYATRSFFEYAGKDTNINWILPGYVYEKKGEYFFGLTEYDLYGSGSFGLIAIMGFDGGIPRESADYISFLCHPSRGAYTYSAEIADYYLMSYLSSFPLEQLENLVGDGGDAYFEFNGTNFYDKDLTASSNYSTWVNAVRQVRIDAGYEQVKEVQNGEVVLAGLLTLASGYFEEEEEFTGEELDFLPDYE